MFCATLLFLYLNCFCKATSSVMNFVPNNTFEKLKENTEGTFLKYSDSILTNKQMSCSVWTAMCSNLNQKKVPQIKIYIIMKPFLVLYITSLTFHHPLWWTSRSHALTYTPDSTAVWQARNTCHTKTPATDPPAVRLSWKTACGECQTGRDHADLKLQDWKSHAGRKRTSFDPHGTRSGQRQDRCAAQKGLN